ncbi:glycosyltransferase [bacterium]|nr:glycosyltransferase [bacterium]
MKILYVAPENVSGGFQLFAVGHRKRGNECRWVTFFKSLFNFEEDICFNLWGMPTKKWVNHLRWALNIAESKPDLIDLEGNPPFWQPSSAMEDILYRVRDIVNAKRIRNIINEYQLDKYDIYHFEQGIDPYRDCRWIKELKRKGKGIVTFYHGTDLRNRGVIKDVYSASVLNLTSEIDLLGRIPGMKYLYLPIDIDKLPLRKSHNLEKKIIIGHAARNRSMKGSDSIEKVVKEIQNDYNIEWMMIENVGHREALEMKAECDIFIDQITDKGGWGYGASSVESLAMGIPTLTMINPKVAEFLSDNPLIAVTPETLKSELIGLLENRESWRTISNYSREWVKERHGIDSVMETLYGYYKAVGLI